MKLYAISDLHLPGSKNKTMEKFGFNWERHTEKIMDNWSKIEEKDIVLMPGDLSWAMDLNGAQPDIKFLSSLKGKKYLVKGNHDYCFKSINKSKEFLKSFDNDHSFIRLIHRDSHVINFNGKKIGLTGTRGWSKSRDGDYDNEKIIKRELVNLKYSLDSLSSEKVDDIIVMIHFPPSNEITKYFIPMRPNEDNNELVYVELYDNKFLDLIKDYNVSRIIFGHVHNITIESEMIIDNIKLNCVSADAIDFNPIEIT